MIHINLTPNTEGQFKGIPTKLELRTKDLCTHLINKSLLKPILTDFSLIWKNLPEFSNLKFTNFGQN